MEQARAFERLASEFKMTQDQMAERTGKDRASMANFLRLLKLPADVQSHVEKGELSFGHARALLALDAPEAILEAARKVVALRCRFGRRRSYVQELLTRSWWRRMAKETEERGGSECSGGAGTGCSGRWG